jgi:hypothetical protein
VRLRLKSEKKMSKEDLMMTPEEKDLLLRYLNPVQPFTYRGDQRHSTLIAGLRDCRQLLNRNLETGDRTQGSDAAIWLAAIGYFSVLDQIGSVFQKVDGVARTRNGNSIVYAIENFSNLERFRVAEEDRERTICALKALRNAFTHDFNLLNIPASRNRDHLEQHKFTVFSDSTELRLVILPERMWDGNIDEKNFNATDDSTFVNLFQIAELVESIYSSIVAGIKDDSVEANGWFP